MVVGVIGKRFAEAPVQHFSLAAQGFAPLRGSLRAHLLLEHTTEPALGVYRGSSAAFFKWSNLPPEPVCQGPRTRRTGSATPTGYLAQMSFPIGRQRGRIALASRR